MFSRIFKDTVVTLLSCALGAPCEGAVRADRVSHTSCDCSGVCEDVTCQGRELCDVKQENSGSRLNGLDCIQWVQEYRS